MPIYEYSCRACGQPSEINHRMSDPPATVCPACGKPELVKQMSAAGFRLKGGGWYETDFKSDGKRNLAGDAGDGAAKPKEAAAAKPESKPAAAAPAATPAATKPSTGGTSGS